MQATAQDLRLHSKKLLSAVARGEEVVITFRGKPCAKLVPFAGKKTKVLVKRSLAFGMWKDRPEMKDVNAYVRQLRQDRY